MGPMILKCMVSILTVLGANAQYLTLNNNFAGPGGAYCTTVTKGFTGGGNRGTPITRTYSIPAGQRDGSLTGFYQQGCSNPFSVAVQACDFSYPEITLIINGQNSDSAAIRRRPPYSGVVRVTLTVYCYSFYK